jgi:hypothetical protein
MDDSNTVTVDPNLENREMAEQETINESVRLEDRNSSFDIANMKRAMEECIGDFSNKLDCMITNFENKLGQSQATPILGRGPGESTPKCSRNLNNSHNMECNPEKVQQVIK